MKKRMAYISTVAIVVLLGTCFDLGNPLPQPTLALSQDFSDFAAWRKNVGITPTQMIRITVANRTTGRSARPLSFQVIIGDQNGVRVFQTARREVPPQGFRYEDIVFGDLGLIDPEPITLRKQFHTDVLIHEWQKSAGEVPVSLEIIDVATGQTKVYDQTSLSRFVVVGDSF